MDHGPVGAQTGLDSWFLHEKLILGLLRQHEIAVLGRQLQLLGPDPSLAQAYRIEWQTPRLRYVKHLNNVTDSESLRYIQICLAWLKMCFHPGYTIP